MKNIDKFREAINSFWKIVAQVQRDKATDMLEFELKEMENIFVILLLGSLVGLPSPPAAMSLELIPFLEDEIHLMTVRADFAQDPLGALAGMLDVD